MLASTTESTDSILARLAHGNGRHLAVLRYEFGAVFGEDDLADILQEAYERATKSLNGDRPPQFSDWQQTVVWFGRVCKHTAIDVKRRRDGRRASEQAARPTLVPLDPLAEHDGDVQLAVGTLDEDLEAVGGSALDEVTAAVVEALKQLPDKHARILYWRYQDGLGPEAVMRLEGLTSMKQYEGRHRRAIKALGRALAGLELGVGCGQARLIMRHHPDALLDDAAGRIRIHVEECVACRAFRCQVRGALAVMPLSPAAIGAKLLLGTVAASPAPTRAAAGSDSARASLWKSITAHPKVVAAVAASGIAFGGVGITHGSGDAGGPTASSAGTQRVGIGSADHGVLDHHRSLEGHLLHDPIVGRWKRENVNR
jgi:DNA-directed RNA polymerase specialized sigma24 family protein